ncbi:MAG: DNA gyrase subunit A [Candidatus Caenarcaniphilales bacterium]|nr:DNA gyrase subunit A [Candidatus Caenarcaniphilales bacterium]
MASKSGAAEDSFRNGGKVVDINVQDEMTSSFISYAMSVIVSRAIPDVRDGLKPVHRRILYAMHDMNMYPDKPFKKCARIVGEVLGKYHPHGDTAVYDSLVRMAQPFSSRYTLINGHGNFGSLDDGPAAMRYTEAKLQKLSTRILADIGSETVDFVDNFDGSLQEPDVLPSKVPNLLLNGGTGIAVGMATNIPPHNLVEVMKSIIALIDKPEMELDELMGIIKGPDFPPGCSIIGKKGIREYFETGRGSITQKGTYTIEELAKGRQAIVITELPYLVGAEAFVSKVAELVKNEKLTGIADANDESGRQGTRIVIKLKKDANANVISNNLLKFTPLQQNFPVNIVALVKGKPKQLGMLSILREFIEFRAEVVTRKAQYDLKKAEARDHILLGLLKALDNIDDIIALIKAAKSSDDARTGLVEKYELSVEQASAILDMQLRRLTGLEREKIEKEHEELLKLIHDLKTLLASRELILEEVKKQSQEVIDDFGDERKTKLIADQGELDITDLIANERMVVFLTTQGYIKRIPLQTFERQRRATKGKGGIKTREEDDLQSLFCTSMHDTLLFFTNRGTVYSAKVFDVIEGSRQHKGQALVNLIQIKPDETITSVIPVSQFSDGTYLTMLTSQGVIKKTGLSDFTSVRKSGIVAINLDDSDELKWVIITDGDKTLVLGTADGMVIRYDESEVRAMGRTARGVKAISLREGDYLVGFDAVCSNNENLDLLVITNDGYGKRVKLSEFRVQGRGGLGLIATKFKSASSKMACITNVEPGQEFMIATSKGLIARQVSENISCQGRMATGVKVQNMDSDDSVISVNKIVEIEESQDPIAPTADSLEALPEVDEIDTVDDVALVDEE